MIEIVEKYIIDPLAKIVFTSFWKWVKTVKKGVLVLLITAILLVVAGFLYFDYIFYFNKCLFSDDIVLSQKSIDKLERSIAYLRELNEKPLNNIAHSDPWEGSQLLFSMYTSEDKDLKKKFNSMVYTHMDKDNFCYQRYPGNKHSTHFSSTAWYVFISSYISSSVNKKTIQFLLDNQIESSFWPQYLTKERKYACTYSTCLVILGLNEYSKRDSQIKPKLKKKINIAIKNGSTWLLQTRDNLLWTDYPYHDEGRTYKSLSAFVIYTLNQVIPETIQELNNDWIENLEPVGTSLTENDVADVWYFFPKNLRLKDDARYLKVPWSLIATVDACKSASLGNQIKSCIWLKDAIENIDVFHDKDINSKPWLRSSVLIALRDVKESYDPNRSLINRVFKRKQGDS